MKDDTTSGIIKEEDMINFKLNVIIIKNMVMMLMNIEMLQTI